MVRDMPRLTKASPPADRTRSTTPSISVSPASAVITTTISSASSHKRKPRAVWPGVPVRSLLSVQHLAGDRPGPGPVAKPKPELPTHDGHGSACRQAGGSEGTDFEGDDAAGRRLANRAVVPYLVAEAEPVDLDLESGVLEQLGGVTCVHADRVGHVDQLRTSGYPDDHGLARLEGGAWGRLLADDGARGILAVGVRLLPQLH